MGLNLRDAPGRSGSRLRTMPDNARVPVVGAVRDGLNPDAVQLWYQVRYQDRTGFCLGDFLALEPAPVDPLPSNAVVDPQRTGGFGLNLRAAPGRAAQRIVTMPDRTPLRITGAARQDLSLDGPMWYQVLFGSQRGFCLGDFLSLTDPARRGPFVGLWPVSFPEKVVTARFNQPRPRFNAPIKAHEGIDLRCGINTPPVVAWADGVVDRIHVWGHTLIGDDNYGNFVRLKHTDLGLLSLYCHLDENSFAVAEGQSVRAGDRLGRADNTGNSRGAHLHFMLVDPLNGLNGYVYPKVIDPTPFLPQPFVTLPDPPQG